MSTKNGRVGFLIAFSLLWSAGPVLAQRAVAHIDDIKKAPDGAVSFPRREPVETVSALSAFGSTKKEWKTAFIDLPLAFEDEVSVKKQSKPLVDKVVILFNDPRRRGVKVGEGSHVKLIDDESIESQGSFFGWFFGRVRASTKYLQAVAKGTQFAVESDGERARLFVWEGAVDARPSANPALSISVGEKMITELIGSGALSAPRVPRFEEIRDWAMFGIDLDPVISSRFRDSRSRRQLQEDLIRSEFESRTRPNELGPQVRLGNIYLYLGRNQDALNQFNAAENVSKRSSDVYNGRGVALTVNQQFAEAETQFLTAIRRDAEARVYNNLGVLELYRSQPDAAQKSFRQAIDIDPMDEAAYNGLSVALAAGSGPDQVRLAEALEAAESSLQLHERALARHSLANVQLLSGSPSEAINNYRQAAQDESVTAAALNNLGVAHLKAADPSAAAEDFLQAIARQPGDATAYCNLGLIIRLQPGLRKGILDRIQAWATTLTSPFDRVAPAYQDFLRQIVDTDAAQFEQACRRIRSQIESLRSQ